MTNKTFTVRITMKTYKSFRRHFKAFYNENAADYFARLAEYLEVVKQENNQLWHEVQYKQERKNGRY